MTLLRFSLFMCLFFLQFSGRASLWGVWPVLQGTCIHGLTEFKADLKYLSVVWEVSGLLHWGAAPCWLRSRQNTFLLFCSLPHHCGVQKNPSPALFLATVMLEVSDVYFVSPFCCILLCFPSVLAATCGFKPWLRSCFSSARKPSWETPREQDAPSIRVWKHWKDGAVCSLMRENVSKAKLICVDGLEIFTVNPARPEELLAVPSFTVRNLTNFKSTKEIYS